MGHQAEDKTQRSWAEGQEGTSSDRDRVCVSLPAPGLLQGVAHIGWMLFSAPANASEAVAGTSPLSAQVSPHCTLDWQPFRRFLVNNKIPL